MVIDRLLSKISVFKYSFVKKAITPECLDESNPFSAFAERIAWKTA